jgi:DNA-binding transcriptional LysR family regulator
MSLPAALLPELPALLVISEELHFGRAAARLNISQPRVSQIVRRIEDVLGYPIFHRRPRVRLTAAGELLTKAARQALDEFQVGVSRARDAAAGRRGTVRVGFAPVSMLTRFPHILKSFHERNPHVELQLQTTYTTNLWVDFEARKYDLILSREARELPGVENHLFDRDNLVVALPEADVLANAAELSIEALADRKFITSEEEIAPQWHEAIATLCRSAGFEPHVTQRTNDWGAMLALVASGLGVSIVSSTLAQIHFPGVTFVPLKEASGIGTFWIASHKNVADPTAQLLLSELLSGVADAATAS